MYSIYFSFEDMTSVKIWRDEIKAAENLLFTPAVVTYQTHGVQIVLKWM